MSDKGVKDSLEFVLVNATGIGLSFGNLEYNLRMFILICTAIYGVIKIIKGYKDLMGKSDENETL